MNWNPKKGPYWERIAPTVYYYRRPEGPWRLLGVVVVVSSLEVWAGTDNWGQDFHNLNEAMRRVEAHTVNTRRRNAYRRTDQ